MDGEDAAFEAAVKLLARRASSESALREKLRRKGHSDDDVQGAVERLASAGYLDDRRVALESILDHSRRGHGPHRVDRELRVLGLADETIAQAWREAEDDYGIDPCQILRDQLRRRLPTPASSYDEAAIRRVYNALLRAGFDEGDVRSALAPHMRDQDADAEAAPADEATTDHPDQRSRETRTNDDSQ
jgi:regulatory protein